MGTVSFQVPSMEHSSGDVYISNETPGPGMSKMVSASITRVTGVVVPIFFLGLLVMALLASVPTHFPECKFYIQSVLQGLFAEHIEWTLCTTQLVGLKEIDRPGQTQKQGAWTRPRWSRRAK